jgi:hypothetical protein
MKNLLLVIFLMLGSICQAQKVEINGYVYFEKTPEAYLSKRIDSLEKRIVSLEKNILTLKSWIEYEKDCYNDSTLVAFETISAFDLDTIMTARLGIPCYVAIDSTVKGIYSHRHYPSFEGFIEYMKRKFR